MVYVRNFVVLYSLQLATSRHKTKHNIFKYQNMYPPSSTATLVKPIFAAEKTPVLLFSFAWHNQYTNLTQVEQVYVKDKDGS